MTNPIFAMTGASGMLGTPIIAELARLGVKPRVLSSSDASAQRLRGLGIEDVVIGDFRNAADLDRLLEDVDTVLHIPPSVAPDEDRIGFDMVDAAERQDVRHFVFMSCFHSVIPQMRHHVNKLVVEQRLTQSGLDWTVLQPSMFMQNLGFIWPKVAGGGQFEWPWDPDQLYAMVDVADIAAATAIVVTDPRFVGGTYELCGRDIVTVRQMAAWLGKAMGRDVRCGRQSAQEWAASMATSGVPEWSVETVRGMCAYHDRYGYRGGSPFVMEAILQRAATSYADFARRWVDEKSATA